MRLKRSFVIFLCLLCIFFAWIKWNISIEKINFKVVQTNFDFMRSACQKRDQINDIRVKTDVMSTLINLSDGNIKEIKLLKYQDKLHSLDKLILFKKEKNPIYTIQDGLLNLGSLNSIDQHTYRNYIVQRKIFKLVNDQKMLYVSIKCILNNGIQCIKTFIFKKGSYDIQIQYKIMNFDLFLRNLNLYGKIKQKIFFQKKQSFFHSIFHPDNLGNISYFIDDNKYNKYSLNHVIHGRNLNIMSRHGWIGLSQKYFIISWIMDNLNRNNIRTYYSHNNQVVIGYQTSNINVFPGQTKILRTILWVGPKIQHKMLSVHPYLDLSIDYGFLWFLSKPLFVFLNILNSMIGNWGFSIVIITFIMRIFTYPLTKFQYLTIAKMKILQPKINQFKQRFQNDPVKLNRLVLKLYKRENIYPLGAFFPVLVQMPIFLSLYFVLVNSIDLRHSPFLFWIYDLSDRDPFYILPIIMGITTFYIQKTSPPDVVINDNITKNIMRITPILLSFIFLWFPSGLVLYYIVSNLVTIVQQIIIYQKFKKNNENK